jgi:hypothetical protein
MLWQQRREVQLDEVMKKVIQDAARVSLTFSAGQWLQWKELVRDNIAGAISKGVCVDTSAMKTIANCTNVIVSLIEDERDYHFQQHTGQVLASQSESPALHRAASAINGDGICVQIKL